jgi:hypothetical protein
MTFLLTWGVCIANRRKEHSKTHKTDLKSIQWMKNEKNVGTSHKEPERLALRETLRFHSWR